MKAAAALGGSSRPQQAPWRALIGLLVLCLLPAANQGQGVSSPPSKCLPGCPGNGVCNEELGRCDCMRGFKGNDCSIPPTPESVFQLCDGLYFSFHQHKCLDHNVTIPCVNGCNGRGTCWAGWCHCKPPYYGADCSLSLGPDGKPQLLAGTGYKTRQKRPHIYIYELPPEYNTWHAFYYMDRPLYWQLWQRMLSSGVRVADGEQADYYFIPLNLRIPRDSKLLPGAIQYIRSKWPWWDRHQGRRHLLVHTGDMGRLEMWPEAKQVSENATFLHHWGLTHDYPYSNWKAAHRPGQDIVVPVHMEVLQDLRTAGLRSSALHPGHLQGTGQRDLQLLFAGRICGSREHPDGTKRPNCNSRHNKGYSQGVRQEVHQHHWNRSGFSIMVRNPQYVQELARARFCLAPTGGGHGHRQILVTFMGCVPLLIGDYVLQPFEPELNWTRFSMSVAQSEIPRLHELLGAVSPAQHDALRASLPCAAQHMMWSTHVGTFMRESGRWDAFETLMEVLRVKAKFPNAKPQDYAALDPDFAAFERCEAPPSTPGNTAFGGSFGMSSVLAVPGGQVAKLEAPGKEMCSISRYDRLPQPCHDCLRKHYRFHRSTVPGGVICCGTTGNLAACPRLWP